MIDDGYYEAYDCVVQLARRMRKARPVIKAPNRGDSLDARACTWTVLDKGVMKMELNLVCMAVEWSGQGACDAVLSFRQLHVAHSRSEIDDSTRFALLSLLEELFKIALRGGP